MRVDRIGSLLVGQLLDAGLARPGGRIPVLMYHAVCDDPEPGVSPYYRLATSPATFRAQMDWLRQQGYRTLDPTSALARRAHSAGADDRLAVITFDDGFRDFYLHAWPVLAEYGFSATVYLPTNFIAATRRSFKGRECLTWSEVRELRAYGIRFGSHTMTHPKLYGLPWNRIRAELIGSRAAMEDELAESVSSFAYPYAFPQEDPVFVHRFGDELIEAGFTNAVTTVIGRLGPSTAPTCIPRLPINDCDDTQLFRRKLQGAYDWTGHCQRLLRRTRSLVPF